MNVDIGPFAGPEMNGLAGFALSRESLIEQASRARRPAARTIEGQER